MSAGDSHQGLVPERHRDRRRLRRGVAVVEMNTMVSRSDGAWRAVRLELGVSTASPCFAARARVPRWVSEPSQALGAAVVLRVSIRQFLGAPDVHEYRT